MIIYRKASGEFLEDVDNNLIVELIQDSFTRQLGWWPHREESAWNESLKFMETVVRRASLPEDCGVLIEYGIAPTSKRVDFVIAGQGQSGAKNLVIVELKRWTKAIATQMDGVVVTLLNSGLRETTHPSYQAYTYKSLLLDYNENIQTKNLTPYSCAYLHNYTEGNPEPLREALYQEIVDDSPLFFKHDGASLQEFLKRHVGKGRGMDILYAIEAGRIRPSKKLVDHVCSMFNGNSVFKLIDEQKIAFEKAKSLALSASKKTVIIVRGGPGTGKSVISVNLLGALLQGGKNVVFVAPNASFRNVMVRQLARENRITRLNTLFKGSSSFYEMESNTYDIIVVDEAHRLKDGSAYQYRGENQVEDVVSAGRTAVFFIDEDQRIRREDIGTIAEIKRIAKLHSAEVHEFELTAQYRCAGAEGYVNWLDHLFQLKESANFDGWDNKDFEFRVYDDPNELRKAIGDHAARGLSARMLAGYAWNWTSEADGNANGEIEDVVVPEFGFRMPWNSRRTRSTWAIDPSGLNQVGCIHTSQGLEFDYVGVVIGKDLRFDPGTRGFKASWSDYKDGTGKKGLKNDPEILSRFVRNVYRILLSRGMKGCFVYACDEGMANYLRECVARLPGGSKQRSGIPSRGN